MLDYVEDIFYWIDNIYIKFFVFPMKSKKVFILSDNKGLIFEDTIIDRKKLIKEKQLQNYEQKRI